jgi:hypothetical protein
MGLKIQRTGKQFGGFATANGVTLEIPYGLVGIIPAPRARKTGKGSLIFANFLSGLLSLLPYLFQRFSHRDRAWTIEAHDREEITGPAVRRVLALPEGRQHRTVTDGISMPKPGLILTNEPPYISWQFK